MAFDPIDKDLPSHLDGATFPARGEELASVAQSNGAPDTLVEELRDLGDETFSGPDEIRAALIRQLARRERARLLRRPD